MQTGRVKCVTNTCTFSQLESRSEESTNNNPDM